MRRWFASLVSVLVSSAPAAASWQVSATVAHAVEGPPHAYSGRPSLVQRYGASCVPPAGVGSARYSTSGIRAFFASQPTEEFQVTGGVGNVVAAESLSGEVTTETTVLGARIFPVMEVVCGAGLGSPSEPLKVQGEPVVAPPWIQSLGVVTPEPLDAAEDASWNTDEPSNIPVGVPVRIRTVIEAQPRGSETVSVHLEGPGVSITRTYFDNASLGAAQRASQISDAFLADPEAVFTATATGELQLWAEFEGLKSEVRTFRVVPLAAASPGTQADSDADEPAGAGCQTAPGSMGLAALLGWLVFFRAAGRGT